MVHCNIAELPVASPVTEVLNNEESVIVTPPLITVHIPVPIEGLLPAMLNVPLSHCEISDPALEVVGKA